MTSTTKKVFISFSSANKSLADDMLEYLEANSIPCFIAHRDISVSDDYPEKIIEAVENCEVLVFLLTQKSNVSRNVLSEIERAFQNQKRVIVFRVENIKLSKNLEFFLSTNQWLEAHELRASNYFGQLVSIIKKEAIPPIPKKYFLPRKILQFAFFFQFIITALWVYFDYYPDWKDLKKVDKVNDRGIKLVDAIEFSGLNDIESKKGIKSRNVLPPENLFKNVKHEIFISGIALTSVFQNQLELLREAKNRGVKIRLLMLHPQSIDSAVINKSLTRFQKFSNTIEASLNVIQKDEDLFKSKLVEVRFSNKIPEIVGLLLDGDIQPISDSINDNAGIVRFCNYLHIPDRNDWYFQFNKKNGYKSAFDDFASEFRYWWQNSIPLDSVLGNQKIE